MQYNNQFLSPIITSQLNVFSHYHLKYFTPQVRFDCHYRSYMYTSRYIMASEFTEGNLKILLFELIVKIEYHIH